ncbi:MAG TPA: serine/threonine-protein kinase [Polyangiaceae bacterium]
MVERPLLIAAFRRIVHDGDYDPERSAGVEPPGWPKDPVSCNALHLEMKCEACGHENVEGARFCAKCGALMPVEAEGPDPLVGQLVGGRYRVTGVLGEGGMGKVYVGEQQMGSTVRKVAIKTLHTHLSKDPSVLQRFHRECGTVAQLEHPNTIKFFDFGATQDGTLYIAMEFVAGKPLSEVLRIDGALKPERVVTIMRQVCGALDEAHLQGIVHRDLKPDNIILTVRAGEHDFVKVLDFGIAARRESADAQKEQKLTQQGMVLGTPPYMSPEQFTGKELDARSDVYSLGVMAYEMLSGKLPFEADTPWQWATQHMTAQPTPFEVAAPSLAIPSGMRDAIMKSLSKNREQRQASARDFFAEVSGGGRMTVTGDGTNPSASGHSDTAAMPQAPDFSGPPPEFPSGPGAGARPGGAAPTAPAFAAPPAYHAPGTGPAVVAHVPPPPAPAGKGGGKGLVLGLVTVGVLLLAAIAVVAARSLKKDDDVGPIVIQPSTATGPAATFAPLPTANPTDTATPAASGSADTSPTSTPTSPTSTPTSKSTAPTPATSGSAKPAGGDACDACIAAAAGGNITTASARARSCTDPAKKSRCVEDIKRAAPSAAKTAALNTNCAQAKAIIAAAKAAGADTAKLNASLKNTSCK